MFHNELKAVQPCSQLQTLLAEVQRLKAEAAEAAQQRDHVSAERDAAAADAGRLRKRTERTKAKKERLAAALDDVMYGAACEQRAAREKTNAAERQVLRHLSGRLFLHTLHCCSDSSWARLAVADAACRVVTLAIACPAQRSGGSAQGLCGSATEVLGSG